MTTKSVNGIDLDRLRATRDLIETDADGSLANPKYESTIVWNNGYRTVSRVTDGQEVTGDEPERYGGSGVGITPEDMLLTAVGHSFRALPPRMTGLWFWKTRNFPMLRGYTLSGMSTL